MVQRINKTRTKQNGLSDWSFKEGESGYVPSRETRRKIPKKKSKAQKKREKKRAKKYNRPVHNFYDSDEWRRLRYRVLSNNDGCCMLCGRSPRKHKVVLHADHIKPRSKHPDLELDYNNLQVLCEACNLGKMNKCEKDWRPDINKTEADELEIVSNASKYI